MVFATNYLAVICTVLFLHAERKPYTSGSFQEKYNENGKGPDDQGDQAYKPASDCRSAIKLRTSAHLTIWKGIIISTTAAHEAN